MRLGLNEVVTDAADTDLNVCCEPSMEPQRPSDQSCCDIKHTHHPASDT